MATVNLESIRTEAESIARFLRAEVPQFARTHRPVTLEPSAPSAAAALWQAVGWSDVFAKARLAPPERDSGETRIVERLAEYRSWGDGFTLTPEGLPTPRRLVEDDGQGVGFLITDEHAGGPDAPVMTVLAERNKVVMEARSYVRWVANEMLTCAFSRLYSTWLAATPASALEESSTQPWPTLSPATRRFDGDVYAAPPDAMARDPQRNGGWTLAHRSVDALVQVLHAAPLDALTCTLLPGDVHEAPTGFEKLLRNSDTLRRIPDEDGIVNWVGKLGGVPVIAREGKLKTRIAVNPRRNAELAEVLRDRRAAAQLG